MGLTAESVHVFVKDGFPGATRNRVAEAARKLLRAKGYDEVTGPSEADRTLTLGPADGRRWIAVFDTKTGSAADLAKALSKETASAAVSMMVFDSDDVFVRLIEGGKIADAFERSEGKTRRADVRRWAAYADTDALREAFGGEPLFAEDQLERLAAALGIDHDLCLTPAEEVEGEEFLRFYFRDRKAAQGKPKEAAGPPVFQVPHHGYRPVEMGVGERLWGSLGAYATNVGGPGTGVRIRVSGSAIDEGLVRVDSITIFQPARPTPTEFVLNQTQNVEVPSLRIDGGMEQPEPRNLLQMVTQLRRQKKEISQRANIVTANLTGAATSVGQGILTLTFEPMDNPGAAAAQSFQIIVRPAVRVPLKADASAPGTQQYMRWMTEASHVVAVAALAPSAPARVAALAAIEKWATFLAPLRPDTWHVLQFGSSALTLPKEHRSASSNLPADRIWKIVRRKFEQSAGCSGHMGDEVREGGESLAGCAGWGFDLSSVPASMLPARFSPQLSFWFDTRRFRDEEAAQAEAFIAAIFDDLLREGYLLQAFQARWKCGDLSSVPMTLYELACGVQGQCTTSEAWCKRYLRGVGSGIWLGADLMGHLPAGSLEALSPLLLAEGVRLTVDPRELDRLEAAIAPILAGHDQWLEGMRSLYQPGTSR